MLERRSQNSRCPGISVCWVVVSSCVWVNLAGRCKLHCWTEPCCRILIWSEPLTTTQMCQKTRNQALMMRWVTPPHRFRHPYGSFSAYFKLLTSQLATRTRFFLMWRHPHVYLVDCTLSPVWVQTRYKLMLNESILRTRKINCAKTKTSFRKGLVLTSSFLDMLACLVGVYYTVTVSYTFKMRKRWWNIDWHQQTKANTWNDFLTKLCFYLNAHTTCKYWMFLKITCLF